jgi:Uncharacterised protein family (UPF0014)
VERLLCLGATRAEACAGVLGRATRLAMTPLLNQMSVVGLVSIPGMMTGQILAGNAPLVAARYQMVIMFMLGAASTTAAVAAVFAAGAARKMCCFITPIHSWRDIFDYFLPTTITNDPSNQPATAVFHVVDCCHRLRPERLLPRPRRGGINGLLTAAAVAVRLTTLNLQPPLPARL